MIQIGNDKIKEIYHGSDKIKEVYHGSELVYTAHAPVVIMTSATNAPVMAICYAQGWCASPDSMTDVEASKVTSIGTAFNRSSANTNIKSFDEFQYFTGITSLPTYAFQHNIVMTSITIPDSVTSIGDYCFYDCRALTSITIPNGVTSIIGCFLGCRALTSINIPDSVTYIGYACFDTCTALTSIYSLRSTAPGLADNPFGASSIYYTGRNTYKQGVNMLYVPQGATGYDAGDWLDPLQNATKCGFTISYTL